MRKDSLWNESMLLNAEAYCTVPTLCMLLSLITTRYNPKSTENRLDLEEARRNALQVQSHSIVHALEHTRRCLTSRHFATRDDPGGSDRQIDGVRYIHIEDILDSVPGWLTTPSIYLV